MFRYKISLDTSGFESKERKTHDAQALDAKLVALNGVSYEYEKLSGPLVNRLRFMFGLQSTIDFASSSNQVTIRYEYKGKNYRRSVPAQLPGTPVIMNDEDEIRKIINKVMKDGIVRVPFSRYYDPSFSSKLKGAYLVIERI